MTIVAHAHPFVIGVDTHARTHTLAVLVAATGEPVATEQFATTAAGLDRAVAWAARHTDGEMATLWVIEGIATSMEPIWLRRQDEPASRSWRRLP